jgi:hypothetical protein
LLTKQHRQEALSRAYVQAIAASCGMSYSVQNPDYGIDLTLNEILIRGQRRTPSGWKLDIQAKSTSTVDVEETTIRYDLDARAYEVLRDPDVPCPRILVVLVLPEEETSWLTHTEENLTIRRCAYWTSLCGREPTAHRKTIRIAIPRANVFSTDGLRGIMDRVRKGNAL